MSLFDVANEPGEPTMKPTDLLALLAAALALFCALPRVCQAEQIVAIGEKCLDIPHGNPGNGTGVQLWHCGSSSPNQRWSFAGDTIVGMGEKCLDVEAGRTEDGTRVLVWNCNGGANQRWQFHDGQFVGLDHKCLDVSAGSTDDGTLLVLWHCTGAANQHFARRPSVIHP
jgi:alpha-galactosidase